VTGQGVTLQDRGARAAGLAAQEFGLKKSLSRAQMVISGSAAPSAPACSPAAR